MMRGRPTLIKNLRIGMPVKIRGWIVFVRGKYWLLDNSEAVTLSGRLKEVLIAGTKHISLIGHLSRRGRFFVEEVDK